MQKYILIITFLFVSQIAISETIEKLEYLLHYGIINGGTATLTTTKTQYKGHDAYHLHMRGKTMGLTHTIYAVDDVYESWIDPVSNLPVKAIRNITEKKYRFYNEVEFFHDKDSLYSQKSGSHVIEGNVCDVISAFNYMRKSSLLKDLKPGDKFVIPIWHIDQIKPLTVMFHQLETIKTENGKVECMRLQPLVETGKLFKRADSFVMWVTNDDSMLPVLFQFNLKIGALKCELQKME